LQVNEICSKGITKFPGCQTKDYYTDAVKVAIFPGANHFTKRYPAATGYN
jgi:hypothetical protein